MNIIIFIFSTLLTILSATFLANAVTAISYVKRETKETFLWNSTLLLLGGFAMMLVIILFMLGITIKVDEKKEAPKFEMIQGPVYREVK